VAGRSLLSISYIQIPQRSESMFRKKAKLKTLFKKTLKDEMQELVHQIKSHFDQKRLIPVMATSPRIKKR
jgi:hypothetical protein